MTTPLSWRMSWMRLQGQLMQRRKAAGLTQEQVATKLGIGRRSFQRWEDGTAGVSAVDLFRWADALGISISSEVHAECATSGAREAAE